MTVAIWRGIAAGWQTIGTRRDPAAADRLISYVRRIRPEFTYRLTEQ